MLRLLQNVIISQNHCRILFRTVKMQSQRNNNICSSIDSSSAENNTNSSIGSSISNNTIYSLSSGFGKCGVSVIRVSGPQAKQALKMIVNKNFEPKSRYAYLKSLYHPQNKEMIDKGLVLWFPAPNSFTGEDSCEFQVHGSLAVIAALLDGLGKIPGLRTAKAGEFTKRAFFNGKLDLTAVEGLADLINAETEAQRKQALLQCNGVLSRLYDNWRTRLIRSVAHLEAFIDFGEDEQLDELILCQLKEELKNIVGEISAHLNDMRQGEILRDGVRVTIIGEPNVGKSSFLNLLCQRNVSIVTPIAGTTRDIIETTCNFNGYPVVFTDTAGLRKSTTDIVELEGISRAKAALKNTDIILLLTDAQQLISNFSKYTLNEYIEKYLEKLNVKLDYMTNKKLLLVANKIDLLTETDAEKFNEVYQRELPAISCKENQNMYTFLHRFAQLLEEVCGSPSAESPRITQARYRQQLANCVGNINAFLTEYAPDVYPDMAISAQKLRNAIRCIEQITGHISADDILDVIFKDFCIGK